MGYMIPDLQAASLPLAGTEEFEIWQNGSRRVRLLDLLPGFDNQLTVDLANDSDAAKGAAMVGGLIANNLTINVPADQPTIAAAMDYLRGYTIARGAVVTIQVADGTYTVTGSVSLNHLQGGRIQLLGNQLAPANCVITVATGATFDGFVCSGGNTFGLLDGFTITRPTKAEMPINTTAILAVQGSAIICGPNIVVSNWFYGIAARDGSYVYCPNAKVSNSGDVGIWSFCGSTVICHGATSTGANAAGYSWGFGFQAEYGATLVGTGLTASGCKIAGIAALTNGTVRAFGATVSSNTGSGFYAFLGGTIEADATSAANNNGRYGVEIIDGNGYVLNVPAGTGNSLGQVNPYAAFQVTAGQGRVISNFGPLRLDTVDSSSVYFNTAGGLQFSVSHIASAANRLDVIGAPAGSFPNMRAVGSDANIDVQITPKGTGVVRVPDGTWNGRHFSLGSYHLWVDASGRLRIKSSAPTSDTDGAVVGTQA